jgi:choline monooxygenase
MSNLAGYSELTRVSPQLPMSWYFDPRVHAVEQEVLFATGPGYVGHELMVPNPGDYFSLDWMNQGKVLVHGRSKVELLSNVCRHRQSTLLQGRGSTANIVCPLHRWTYDLDGKLLGAPHFSGNPCLDLPKTPLKRWNGMLFSGKRDVAKDLIGLSCQAELDFEGYIFDRATSVDYNFNWKTFVEVYLELYHVVPFHPGLGSFVNCDDLQWDVGDRFSTQIVGVNSGLTRAGSATYHKWHEAVRTRYQGSDPVHGAIWMIYYPNIMIEWYPNVLVISTLIPRGPEKCTNVVEFYYPEEIALFERDYIVAEQAAYEETALEDEEICLRMTRGRRALYEEGVDPIGPYQSPMEDGMVHFHEFLHRELDPRLKP